MSIGTQNFRIPSVLILANFFAFLCGTSLVAQDQAKLFEHQADRCDQILKQTIIDFYLPGSADPKQHGYLEALGDDGKFVPTKEKFLTFQARQTWFFSCMAVNKPEHRLYCSAFAEMGWAGLTQSFYDQQNGGYFLKVSDQGKAVDDRKHAYPLSFVIYALVEMHRITDSPSPLQQARELFLLLELHCHDKKHLGYYELFTRDWKKITDTEQWGVVGTVGNKTYNTHLHLLEAFTQLYMETQDPLVGKRLEELIKICTQTVRHPQQGCNIDAWTVDWKMIESKSNLRTSYGHDLECAWLVLAAADALGKRTPQLEAWAVKLCDHAIEYGHDDQHGGFFYSGPLGKPSDDRKKEWWTQSEALVALLTCYQITRDEKYFKQFRSTFDFIQQHHLAKEGGWYASLNEDGTLGANRSRSSMWQGGYHNGRAMLLCEKMLREFAAHQRDH